MSTTQHQRHRRRVAAAWGLLAIVLAMALDYVVASPLTSTMKVAVSIGAVVWIVTAQDTAYKHPIVLATLGAAGVVALDLILRAIF